MSNCGLEYNIFTKR